MFEAAEVGRKLEKDITRRRSRNCAAELLDAQQQSAARAVFPVIVLFAGVDGAGKSETVNLLNEWMDPRWIVTRGYTRSVRGGARAAATAGATGATCRRTGASRCF